MISRFGAPVANLSQEQRLRFYEALGTQLTIAIRDVWSDTTLSAPEQVEQMKWINEILHRIPSKISTERTQSRQWLDTDFEAMVEHWVSQNPRIAKHVNRAINLSYQLALA